MGSVSPLLALFEEMQGRIPHIKCVWVGTITGPEKKIAESYGIEYVSIASGKLRRYFSAQNFLDTLSIILGFFQSIFFIIQFKPSLVLTAGGFVAVPLVWAAWVMRVPVHIHQQDARIGLANKLMAPFASLITATFEKNADYFKNKNVVVTGNPLRKDLISLDKEKAIEFFGFSKNLPVILIIGGGTGALVINKYISDSFEQLITFCQIIHSTGEGKMIYPKKNSRYRAYEFLYHEGLSHAYSASDLVVSRAGMSTLTELSRFAKPALVIPIPQSHQEDNAREFENKNAARVLHQQDLTSEKFVKIIQESLQDKNLLKTLSENIGNMFPKDAAEKAVGEIIKITKQAAL